MFLFDKSELKCKDGIIELKANRSQEPTQITVLMFFIGFIFNLNC